MGGGGVVEAYRHLPSSSGRLGRFELSGEQPLRSALSGRRLKAVVLLFIYFFFLPPLMAYRKLGRDSGWGRRGRWRGHSGSVRKEKKKPTTTTTASATLLQCVVTKREVGIYRRDNLAHSSDCCQTTMTTRQLCCPQLCVINPPPHRPSPTHTHHHPHPNAHRDKQRRPAFCAGGGGGV